MQNINKRTRPRTAWPTTKQRGSGRSCTLWGRGP